MSIAGRLGAVYFTRSQQFHQAPHSGCSFLSSPLTKVTQGLQQCRPSYCIAYHSKPLDAAPWSAARGLFHENCCFFKPIFCEIFEIAAVQKDANLVQLEKCCQTHIFLQNFVLIQPRTSPPKICKIFEKCIFENTAPTPGRRAASLGAPLHLQN